METGGKRSGSGLKWLGWGGLAISVAALVFEAGAGVGTRLDLWNFRTGFTILGRASWLGGGGAAISALALIVGGRKSKKWGNAMAATGIILGLLAIAIPGSFYWTAKHVPMIHDITTDIQNPPRFVALLETRKNAPNGAEYGGPEVAEKQRAAYPDVKTIDVDITPAAAFSRALETVKGLGWQLVDADAGAGRIEATDTTRWFGFKDDIVIRVVPGVGGNGSRIDLRSVSRVGNSDVGKNASRIRTFIKAFSVPAPGAS